MCGLAGFTGHKNADPTKLRMLLLDNQSRGSHSTGMYGYKAGMLRMAAPASEFIKSDNFDRVAKSNVVIAHTRHATSGEKTKKNAHPFLFYILEERSWNRRHTIVGTHNGFVVNQHEISNLIPEFEEEEVDSRGIYKAMTIAMRRWDDPDFATTRQALGINRPFEIFSLFEGAMALAFIIDGYLLLYRRESRPLFIGSTKEGFYYSSLRDSLVKIGIRPTAIVEVKPHTLFIFKGAKLVEQVDIKLPRVSISEHQTTYTWDAGVGKDLLEKLTGKKPVVPQQRQIGFGATTEQSGGKSEKEVDHRRVSTIDIIAESDLNPKMISTIRGGSTLIPSVGNLSNIYALEAFLKGNHLRDEDKNKVVMSNVVNRLIRKQGVSNFWINEFPNVAQVGCKNFFESVTVNEPASAKSTTSLLVKPRLIHSTQGLQPFFNRNDVIINANTIENFSPNPSSIRDDKEAGHIHLLEAVKQTKTPPRDEISQFFISPDYGVSSRNDDKEYMLMSVSLYLGRIPGITFRTSFKIFKGHKNVVSMLIPAVFLSQYIEGLRTTYARYEYGAAIRDAFSSNEWFKPFFDLTKEFCHNSEKKSLYKIDCSTYDYEDRIYCKDVTFHTSYSEVVASLPDSLKKKSPTNSHVKSNIKTVDEWLKNTRQNFLLTTN